MVAELAPGAAVAPQVVKTASTDPPRLSLGLEGPDMNLKFFIDKPIFPG
jgi:hypothetical protein